MSRCAASFGLACLLLPLPAQQAPAAPATRTFQIRVEDERGRPVGDVPVMLGENRGDVFGLEPLRGVPPVRSGPDGMAVLTCAAAQPRTWLMAQAQVLAEPPVRVGLAADPDKLAHHVLRLPPTGQVRVLVYGDDERPLRGVTSVDLALDGNRRFFDRVLPAGRAEAEGALFARVALGQKLLVKASLQDTHGALETQRDGPTRAGELVVIDLRLRDAQLLTLRVLGRDGAPAATATLGGFLLTDQACTTVELSTAADGTLRYVLPPGHAGAEQAALHLVRRGGDGDEYLGAVRVPLVEPWQGTRALGDVRLVEEPPAVRGTLVDENGKPMPGVELVAEMSLLQGARISSANADSWPHRVRTDEKGHFCLRELEPRDANLAIRADGPVCLVQPAVVRIGDTEAVLKGSRPGSAVVGLPGLPAGLTVRCVAMQRRVDQGPGAGGGSPVLERHVTTDRGIEFRALQPGTYDLEIGASSLGPPVHRVEGIEVRGGEACTDPRLRVVDWQQHLRLVRCRVEGAAELRTGAQLLIGEVASNGYAWQGFGHLDDLPPQLLVPRGRKLTVHGPACRTVVIDDPSGDVKLVLAPRPRVQLTVGADVLLPDDLVLHLAATERAWVDTQGEVPCGTAKSWTLLPDGPGAFTATLRAPNGDGTFADVWSGALVIPEGEGPHELRLPIDADTAKALRERAAARR